MDSKGASEENASSHTVPDEWLVRDSLSHKHDFVFGFEVGTATTRRLAPLAVNLVDDVHAKVLKFMEEHEEELNGWTFNRLFLTIWVVRGNYDASANARKHWILRPYQPQVHRDQLTTYVVNYGQVKARANPWKYQLLHAQLLLANEAKIKREIAARWINIGKHDEKENKKQELVLHSKPLRA